MSAGRTPSGHGGHHDPEFRVGRGKPARRRIVALALGIIAIVFAVLLIVWLLARSATDAHSTAEAGSVAHHSGAAELVVEEAAQTSVDSASRGDQAA